MLWRFVDIVLNAHHEIPSQGRKPVFGYNICVHVPVKSYVLIEYVKHRQSQFKVVLLYPLPSEGGLAQKLARLSATHTAPCVLVAH